MPIDAHLIAKELAISEEELTRKSLRAFLMEQLRLLEADRKARCAKFGASDLLDMERLIEQGKVAEEAILQDYQEVDYLTDRAERVRALLEEP